MNDTDLTQEPLRQWSAVAPAWGHHRQRLFGSAPPWTRLVTGAT